jgi:hypothetical protein
MPFWEPESGSLEFRRCRLCRQGRLPTPVSFPMGRLPFPAVSPFAATMSPVRRCCLAATPLSPEVTFSFAIVAVLAFLILGPYAPSQAFCIPNRSHTCCNTCNCERSSRAQACISVVRESPVFTLSIVKRVHGRAIAHVSCALSGPIMYGPATDVKKKSPGRRLGTDSAPSTK